MFLTPRQGSQKEQELPQETMRALTKYAGFFPQSFQVCSLLSTAPSTMTENSSQVQGAIPSAAVSTSVPPGITISPAAFPAPFGRLLLCPTTFQTFKPAAMCG